MLNTNHMIVNVASVGAIVSLVGVVGESSGILSNISLNVAEYFVPSYVTKFTFCFWIVFLLLGVMLGSCLPDIDSEKSILGRYIHLPFKHRTWTHTVWMFIPLVILSIVNPIFGCITYGYFMHLVVDTFSRAGVCWFYPFQKYIRYGNGAFVKKNHKLKLYRGGKMSEGVCVGILVSIFVVIMMYYGCCLSGFNSFINMIAL